MSTRRRCEVLLRAASNSSVVEWGCFSRRLVIFFSMSPLGRTSLCRRLRLVTTSPAGDPLSAKGELRLGQRRRLPTFKTRVSSAGLPEWQGTNESREPLSFFHSEVPRELHAEPEAWSEVESVVDSLITGSAVATGKVAGGSDSECLRSARGGFCPLRSSCATTGNGTVYRHDRPRRRPPLLFPSS